MPELAEVVFNVNQWQPGCNRRVQWVVLHENVRVFRETSTERLSHDLPGRTLQSLATHGKQMLVRFSRDGWLGLHLGMTGQLLCEPEAFVPATADHLVLYQKGRALVFRDPRQFGRVRWHVGTDRPIWWRDLPPELLSEDFTTSHVQAFLQRHRKAPMKRVLLDQTAFPGIGNWMADEILWRARIHPACPAGRITRPVLRRLYEAIRFVAQGAMETVAVDYADPPESWLMRHRWRDGGRCPMTKKPLVRRTIGGRTTAFSPARQTFPPELREPSPPLDQA